MDSLKVNISSYIRNLVFRARGLQKYTKKENTCMSKIKFRMVEQGQLEPDQQEEEDSQ
jgi:hypothetical protein